MSIINSLDVILRSTITGLSKVDSLPQPVRNRQESLKSRSLDPVISYSWFNTKPIISTMTSKRIVADSFEPRRQQRTLFTSSSSPSMFVSLKPKSNVSDSRWGYTRHELNYKLAKALRSRRKMSTVYSIILTYRYLIF